ncbi:MAG TPA: peptidoglycan-associated lipoprotein Pal [Burkholderiaceae bacterium]|jgi:peptidoglycan-associated lipoprotein
MKKIILCAAIVSLLAACSSAPVKPEDQTASAQTSSAAKSGATSSNATTASVGSAATQGNPLKDPNNILSKRSVYFAFDQYVIDDKYRPLILAHAAYLKSHPEAKVTLEGNADERGGSEYNLALGQKRADAVRKMMELSGASAKQMEAVSFGKEKPKAAEHNEAAWAENRRTDVHYKGE